ncbi:unnamed protein product [Clonostachys byssicola]|uniref:Uncharacterized protein n=1 Tax=Clonostachys byssicola TaxID=160290 RepID=A0A9N9Y199_9HYPO|nr:unnamed protein product [Clonostachys byssicola]
MLQEAKGDKTKLDHIMEDVAAVISARHITGNPPLVVKLKRSTGGNMVTSYMLFICLGQNKDASHASPSSLPPMIWCVDGVTIGNDSDRLIFIFDPARMYAPGGG